MAEEKKGIEIRYGGMTKIVSTMREGIAVLKAFFTLQGVGGEVMETLTPRREGGRGRRKGGVKKGMKIKKAERIEAVKKLKEQGMSMNQIAEKLNTSTSSVFRDFKEIKKTEGK